MITESDRLAEALDSAGALWPEIEGDRGALLRRIIEAGVEAIQEETKRREDQRQDLVAAVAGTMTGIWPVGWRDELRDEWPT